MTAFEHATLPLAKTITKRNTSKEGFLKCSKELMKSHV